MTITLDQIETAFGQAVEAVVTPILGAEMVVWPNRTDDPARPFVVFDLPPYPETQAAVSGGDRRAEGFTQVTVVSKLNEFTRPSNILVQQVKDAFPFGRRIAAGDGAVVVSNECEVVNRGRDRGDWRVVLQIPFRLEAA